MTGITAKEQGQVITPQWSPPLIGGMTPPQVPPDGIDQLVPQWSPPLIGGMTGVTRRGEQYTGWPQWSPPLIGGMTNTAPSRGMAVRTPQWSPPLIGGMTRSSGPLTGGITCRNGARR